MHSRSLVPASAAALLLLCAACGPTTPPPRLVLLVSIDTLRPDHLGAYGYARPTSPTLDRIAAGGALFEVALSPAPWTLPGHASMLTGLYPHRHGLTALDLELPADVETVASRFQAAGYATAAFVNSHNLSERYDLDRGFDEYVYVKESVSSRFPSRLIVDRAIQWLGEPHDAPAFVFLHTYDVHSDYASLPRYEERFVRPYDGSADGTTSQLARVRHGLESLDEGDASHLVDLYDAGIRQVDDELARLVAFLAERGLEESTLLAITSDHGEEFLEHGGVLHGRTQFDEVLRVPLVLRGPGIPPGLRIETPVSLVDVMPTLLGLTGLSPPAGLDGIDVGPLVRGGALPDRVLFGEADHNRRYHDVTRSARHGRYKLHVNRKSGERALYDLREDPGEHVDVASRETEVAHRLLREIERFRGERVRGPRAPQLSEEEAEHLRSLGYLD